MAQLIAFECDRCGSLNKDRTQMTTTSHVTVASGLPLRTVDHSDMQLCPKCAPIFEELLSKFLEV